MASSSRVFLLALVQAAVTTRPSVCFVQPPGTAPQILRRTTAGDQRRPHLKPRRSRRDDQEEMDDMMRLSLYGEGKELSRRATAAERELEKSREELTRRATTAERELERSREELKALAKERESFLKERDQELETLEKATAQTQRTQQRLKELEEDLRLATEKIAKTEARESEALESLRLKEEQLLTLRMEAAEKEKLAAFLEASVASLEKKVEASLVREARTKAAVQNAKRDNAGLQNLLNAQDQKAKASIATLEGTVSKWKARAAAAEKERDEKENAFQRGINFLYQASFFLEDQWTTQTAETRRAAQAQLEQSQNLRVKAEAEARLRTSSALKAAAERQAAEEDLKVARHALDALQQEQLQLQDEARAMEAELNSLSALSRRLASRLKASVTRRVWQPLKRKVFPGTRKQSTESESESALK